MVPTKCIIPEVNLPTAAQIIICAVFWFLNFQISVSDCVLHTKYMYKTHKSNFHWYLSMAAQNPWQEVNLNFLKQECVSKSRPAWVQHVVSPPDYLQVFTHGLVIISINLFIICNLELWLKVFLFVWFLRLAFFCLCVNMCFTAFCGSVVL